MSPTNGSAPQPAQADSNEAAPRAVDWENPRVAAILAAAAKCFARKGFSATTLAEIGKELGLRKSIVHYYFASKAALIHEVQSYTYHKYLDRVREAIAAPGDGAGRAMNALQSLWDAIQSNKTVVGLNIEVWSAARRDPELKRRAAALQKDARELIAETVGDALANTPADQREAMATLVLSVLNGLAVSEYIEGDDAKAKEAWQTFLALLRLGAQKSA